MLRLTVSGMERDREQIGAFAPWYEGVRESYGGGN